MPDLIAMACRKAEGLLDKGAPYPEILVCLVSAAEALSGGRSVASILVLDENGLLRNGASPNLPRDYLTAIDRILPDADVGTCAAAAATGRVVVTPSFLADEKWSELRHLPLAIGFQAAWSMPIKSHLNGKVLGTFGTYFRDERSPTEAEISSVTRLASVAARVLDSRELQN